MDRNEEQFINSFMADPSVSHHTVDHVTNAICWAADLRDAHTNGLTDVEFKETYGHAREYAMNRIIEDLDKLTKKIYLITEVTQVQLKKHWSCTRSDKK